MAATPVFAQSESIRFRTPDRPIPSLGPIEGVASDSSKLPTIGPSAADQVLTRIDRELAPKSTGAPADGDAGRADSSRRPSESPQRRALGGTTFK
ncbi:MAG TPA: hypothetical protein VFM24_07425 [Nitrospira sp.]|nr:hypothetical protein [Nitrospira sp.]